MNDERVVVLGYGLIALSCAAALAERGIRVTLIGRIREGEASPAAAGMLAPGVDGRPGAAHDFAVAARDRYVTFIDWIQRATGARIALDRNGILQIGRSAADAATLQKDRARDAKWIDAAQLRALEPALSPAYGALLHEFDGAVDNAALVIALREYAARAPGITVVNDLAVAIEAGADEPTVRCAAGRHYTGSAIVVAMGAWTPELAGLARTIPVEPLRGQMLELAGCPVRHVAFAGHGYVVPRAGGTTFVGSTAEQTGFDNATTEEGGAHLRAVAATISPSLGTAPTLRHWSGLRPMSPDMMPIIGRDPERPALIYAAGHSRNGVLMAPLTGDCIAALACGEEPPYDLTPFSPTRFKSRSNV
jgi:glycine oxidase